MEIRKAQPQDAPELVPLLAQLGYMGLDIAAIEQKIKQYSRDDYALLVCEQDGRLEGFIALHMFEIFHSPGRAGRITAFCIHERARGKGLGITMLQETEKYFAANACSVVEVTSNNRRTATHEFYLNRGYANSSQKFIKQL